jgi:HAE1 family hydrophobic/amphiphilic exporter-1
LGDVAEDIEARLTDVDLPASVVVRWGGDVENQREAFDSMLRALLLAALLVYLVMAGQFESFRDPFIIVFAMPFAITGAFLFLLATGTSLSMTSFLGLIILMGIVVNNAIVLVDYVNQLRRKRGMSVREALLLGGERRLRPVLMTTITTISGMLPLAFTTGEGAVLWVPMGRAAIGGLLVSTVVTLVLVPVIYSLVHRMRPA